MLTGEGTTVPASSYRITRRASATTGLPSGRS